MKKSILFLLILSLAGQTIYSQKNQKNFIWNETPEQRTERMKWWTEARFGMFIHWGIYAQPARGEWVKTNERMSEEEYGKYFDLFNPDLYNPRKWAKMAKNAGMKYVIITSKHHDGFCLWDSEHTDYKSTNTPYGKDLLQPFVEAFRDEGLRVGFYYSAPDWHHNEYPINQGSLIHPMRDNEELLKKYKDRDINKYIEYMHKQLRELMTKFGPIDIFWSDYGGDVNRNREDDLLKIVRGLQPQIMLNDRVFEPDLLAGWGIRWDYRTPEQAMPKEWVTMDGVRVPWETCQTLNGSWGYRRETQSTSRYGWKTTHQLLRMLIEVVSKGGNLLLNIGPTARGTFDENTMDRLNAIGQWMHYHSRSIYNCTAAPEGFKTPENCLLTYNPEMNRMYIHILEWPIGKLHLEGFAGKVKYAQLLNDASEIQFAGNQGHWDWVFSTGEILTLNLPVMKPNVEIPVIELILK